MSVDWGALIRSQAVGHDTSIVVIESYAVLISVEKIAIAYRYWDLCMGRARDLFDLALAVGAIAGSAAVLSPQLLWNDGQMQSMTSARAISTSSRSLPLAPFVGIAQFVKQPADYRVDIDGQLAEVTAASLVGEQMTIDYAYGVQGDRTTGKLVGTIDGDGIFVGTRRADEITTRAEHGTKEFSADVNFAFSADGTAESKRGKDVSVVRLLR